MNEEIYYFGEEDHAMELFMPCDDLTLTEDGFKLDIISFTSHMIRNPSSIQNLSGEESGPEGDQLSPPTLASTEEEEESWTKEDRLRLAELVKFYGHDWDEVSKCFEGPRHSPVDCQQQYQALIDFVTKQNQIQLLETADESDAVNSPCDFLFSSPVDGCIEPHQHFDESEVMDTGLLGPFVGMQLFEMTSSLNAASLLEMNPLSAMNLMDSFRVNQNYDSMTMYDGLDPQAKKTERKEKSQKTKKKAHKRVDSEKRKEQRRLKRAKREARERNEQGNDAGNELSTPNLEDEPQKGKKKSPRSKLSLKNTNGANNNGNHAFKEPRGKGVIKTFKMTNVRAELTDTSPPEREEETPMPHLTSGNAAIQQRNPGSNTTNQTRTHYPFIVPRFQHSILPAGFGLVPLQISVPTPTTPPVSSTGSSALAPIQDPQGQTASLSGSQMPTNSFGGEPFTTEQAIIGSPNRSNTASPDPARGGDVVQLTALGETPQQLATDPQALSNTAISSADVGVSVTRPDDATVVAVQTTPTTRTLTNHSVIPGTATFYPLGIMPRMTPISNSTNCVKRKGTKGKDDQAAANDSADKACEGHGPSCKKRKRRTAAEIERKYKCEMSNCTKAYGSEGALKMHIKLKHPGIKQQPALNSNNGRMPSNANLLPVNSIQ